MQSLHSNIKPFSCLLHPSEEIQRVCLEPYSENSLQCIECILQTKGHLPKDKFCQVSDFINYAAEQYKGGQETRSTREPPPSSLIDFLAYEDTKTKALAEHIEREKQKLDETFNFLLEEFTLICRKKKEEISAKLDMQLVLLKNNYALYKSKIDKYYHNQKQEFDQSSLLQRINQCEDSQQLEMLVKNLKEDILQQSNNHSLSPQDFQNDFKAFVNEFNKQSNKTPRSIFNDFSSRQKSLEGVKNLLQELSEIQDPVQELSGRNLSFDSKIITKARDSSLTKDWLRSSVKNAQLRLLYRRSRDGYDVNTFHEMCDDYELTLTVAKSKSGNIFGGYSDQSWKIIHNYKKSNKCWLFSIDHQEKYPVKKNSSQSIYTYANYGPTFGGGHDLYLNLSSNNTASSYSSLGHSYECDPSLNSTEKQCRLAGSYQFEIEDVEIFAVQSSDLLDSFILNPTQDLQLIQSWITKFQNMELELIYRGSRDGFDAKAFHAYCDNQGPTLVVCKSAGSRQVFGGYTSQNWSKSNWYFSDKSAFLFSVSHSTKHIIQDSEHAIFCNEETGPTFGRGYDLFIGGGNFHKNVECNSALGTTYKTNVKIGDSRKYLAGEANFSLQEIEVFKVLTNFDFKRVEKPPKKFQET